MAVRIKKLKNRGRKRERSERCLQIFLRNIFLKERYYWLLLYRRSAAHSTMQDFTIACLLNGATCATECRILPPLACCCCNTLQNAAHVVTAARLVIWNEPQNIAQDFTTARLLSMNSYEIGELPRKYIDVTVSNNYNEKNQ